MLVLKELEKVIRTRQEVEAAFRIVAWNDSDTDDDGTMLSEIIDVTIEQAREDGLFMTENRIEQVFQKKSLSAISKQKTYLMERHHG